MEKPTVLFVITQETALCTLSKAPTGSEHQWQSIRVTDVQMALDVLSQRTIGVVVACFDSDRVACNAFLKKLQELYPAIIRLSLLPEALKNDAAAVSGSAHQTLTLQSGHDVIETAIQSGLSLWRRTKENDSLAALLSKLDKLPTPPELYFNIRDEIESPCCSSASIAALISHDQAMSAKMLKVANSGFYAASRSVANLHEAISLLGMDMVQGLVLSVHLYDRLPLPGFNLDALWMHGFIVSEVARHIARLEGGDAGLVNTCGVAGLLHDIGSLVMVSNFPSQYQPILRQADADEHRAIELEREYFGVAHPELGAFVLDLWCMPDDVVEAVAYHHSITHQSGSVTSLPAKCVFLADWTVNEYVRLGGGGAENTDLICPLGTMQNQFEKSWQVCKQLHETAYG
jgi:HD-like signal output (HDOD) protein